MKIHDRVALVGSGGLGYNMSHNDDCNVYLLDGGGELALIDIGSGAGIPSILDRVHALGYDVGKIKKLFLTHAHIDHAGGAGVLKERLPDVEVCLSEDIARVLLEGDEKAVSLDLAKRSGFYPKDYVFYPCSSVRGLSDGDRVQMGDLQVEVHATPGHAAGHLAYSVTIGEKLCLFSGDLIFHGGKILLQAIWDCELQPYIASIKKMAELPVDLLLTGHTTFLLSDGSSLLRRVRDQYLSVGLIPGNLL